MTGRSRIQGQVDRESPRDSGWGPRACCQIDCDRKVVMIGRSVLPVVCTLTPQALEARRLGLLSELATTADNYERNGIRMQFAPTSDTLSLLTRAVEAECHCCCFSGF